MEDGESFLCFCADGGSCVPLCADHFGESRMGALLPCLQVGAIHVQISCLQNMQCSANGMQGSLVPCGLPALNPACVHQASPSRAAAGPGAWDLIGDPACSVPWHLQRFLHRRYSGRVCGIVPMRIGDTYRNAIWVEFCVHTLEGRGDEVHILLKSGHTGCWRAERD